MQTAACSLCCSENVEPVVVLRDFAFNFPGDFPLQRCRECGLMYLSPRPEPSQISTYYPESYTPYKTAIEDEHWAMMRWMRRRNIRKYRRIVEKFAPEYPKSIIDLGSSTGIFLSEMQSAGWTVQGIEISPSAAQYARERFNLDIVNGRLIEVYNTIPIKSITAVTMWDVLEHTFDPLKTMKILNTRLLNGGVVILTIPHWESLDRKLFGKYWIGYDAPRHLHVFTRPVLRKMIMQAGFEILQMQCSLGGYYTTLPSFKHWANASVTPSAVREMVLRILNIPGLRFLTLPFDTLLEMLGLGNKLLVIARKVQAAKI